MAQPLISLDTKALLLGVEALTSPETPVVTAERLKRWFDENGIDWGGDDKGRKGRLFEIADSECTGGKLMSKWKRNGPRNAPVGWALPASRVAAQEWAATNGWHNVKM